MLLKYKNNDINYEKQLERFLNMLEPFLLKARDFPPCWTGTARQFSGKKENIEIRIYKVCEEVKEILMMPQGIFNWRYPYYPEDLAFFKDGYSWFYTTTHEKYARMYLYDEKFEIFNKWGIQFKFKKVSKNVLTSTTREEAGIDDEMAKKLNEMFGYELADINPLFEEYKFD